MAYTDRFPHVRTNVTLTSTLATTAAIDLRGVSGGDIYLKPNSAVTGLTFYAAADEKVGVGGTTLPYLPAFDDAAPTPAALAYSSISVGAPGACIPFPSQCFAKAFVKIVLVGVASEAVDIVTKG